MLALRFQDTRDIMKKLLAADTFDSFLLSEASVTTFTAFSTDGSWHPEYYDDDPKKAAGDSAAAADQPSSPPWALIRPVMFQIIKGKHTPVSFKVVLKLPDGGIRSLFQRYDTSFDARLVAGLFINISYRSDEVLCTTGTSMKTFTMDKTADHVWDEAVLRFFTSKQILVSEV